MKAALYARVSTAGKGQDADLQLRDLREYAAARGWEVFREYVDVGQSGAKDRRPELDAMLADARKRKVDLILVWRLDRLGRSLRHLVMTLDELRALGVGFVSYHENLDLTSPTGRLMFHLLGAFAQFERELIRERVRAGIANARAKGKRHGRPGVLSPERAAEIRMMRSRGASVRRIADTFGVSKSLVHRTLAARSGK
ncbi:MAG: recombinase family protein [Candidatus Nitrospinota bacterium M3_3B_026]